MTADGVRVQRGSLVEIMAECRSCGWGEGPFHSPAIRSAARRHAARTGHKVGILTTRYSWVEPDVAPSRIGPQ